MRRGAQPAKARKLHDLEKRLAEALEQQAATAEILRVISSSPTDVQPVLDAVAERAARLCHAFDAVIFRLDGDVLRRAAHYGPIPAPAGFFIPVTRSRVTGRAALDGQPVQVADAQTKSAEFPETSTFAREHGFRTILSLPLLGKNGPLGTIDLRRTEVDPFTEAQIALLKTFADQAVIAIENVQLFNETKEALEQQTATAEILRAISGSPTDVQPVLEAVVRAAARFCGAPDVFLLRLDGDVLRGAAGVGPFLDEVIRRAGSASAVELPVTRGSVSGRAVCERRTVHVRDLAAEPETEFPIGRELQRRFGQRSTAATPLLREGQPLGAIVLFRTEVDPFSDKHLELLRTFADQAVIAIENVRLFKETKEALEQQTATATILSVISSSPTDVQPVFEAIAESSSRLCGGMFSSVYRFDGELIHLVAQHNYPPAAVELSKRLFPARPGRHLFVARAILERGVVYVPNVLADTEHFPRELVQAFGFRSALAVPMLRGGEPIGAIIVWHAEVGPFSHKHVALLQTFADQAVIAVENARLFKELETRTEELTRSVGELQALGEVGHAIGSTLDLQTVLDTIVARATQLAGVDAGIIYEYDPQCEIFEPRATHQLEEEIVQTLVASPVRKGEGATGRLADVREPIQLPDIRTTTIQSQVRDALLRAGYRGLLAVPLLREGYLIGGLTVIRKLPGEFGPEIVELLTTFATQSALAIQNARLFREIQGKSRELETLSRNMEQLYRLSTAMQEPLSLKEQLGRVLETATRIGLLDRIYVWAVNPEGDRLVNLAGAGFAADETKQFEGFTIPLVEAGAMYRSLREGRSLLFDDENPLPRDLYLKPQYLLKGLRTNRFLVIPMIARGEPVGVFAGDNKPSGRPIPRGTVELLRTFASHGAVAIANARLFQTIEEKSRELEVASRHKSEFLANMSHELRTPLNAIIGFSEVLSQEMFGAINAKQTEYLRDILESGQHLLSLINDILDLSKIEAGRMGLEPTDFHLPTAIENALILVRERASRREITLARAIDERLGMIRADERKVKQVLLNLLSNALKFTPEGGRVDVRADVHDALAEIAVTDTGIGIALEDQEAVFEEFRQVGTAAKKVEGTGLGLALARRFIELHGGRMWVKSQVGSGSTFTFTLPLPAALGS
jgi:GAF domain-containing protein